VFVLHVSGRLHLALQPADALRVGHALQRQQLDGHLALQQLVHGAIDHSHSTAAKTLAKAIVSQPQRRGQLVGGRCEILATIARRRDLHSSDWTVGAIVQRSGGRRPRALLDDCRKPQLTARAIANVGRNRRLRFGGQRLQAKSDELLFAGAELGRRLQGRRGVG
jgi:hypothetical protein